MAKIAKEVQKAQKIEKVQLLNFYKKGKVKKKIRKLLNLHNIYKCLLCNHTVYDERILLYSNIKGCESAFTDEGCFPSYIATALYAVRRGVFRKHMQKRAGFVPVRHCKQVKTR